MTCGTLSTWEGEQVMLFTTIHLPVFDFGIATTLAG
jgi:hypothetical protein